MTIQGKKFSGNAQYIKQGRIMHHGTLMFDSNLDAVEQALQVSRDKLQSKGVPSVRSRVTNIRPFLSRPMTTREFWDHLRDFLDREHGLEPYALTEVDLGAVRQLRDSVYARWDWNYGQSPAYQIEKRRRIEGCGEIQVCLDADEGVIRAISFYGDYFGLQDSKLLAQKLVGVRLEEAALRQAIRPVALDNYFHGITPDAFCALLLS